MDPLSITLAVVSLTTAVKDLVEVGQKIHNSFAKAPENFRKAQLVADEIKEMLEEIQAYYEAHKDAVDNTKDFSLALQGLLAKLRGFETSVLPLLPQQKSNKMFGRLLRGRDAWRNRNKVEAAIQALQLDVVKVMRQYIVKSAVRTEAQLGVIHQETSRGLEVLDVVQRDVSAIRITTTAIAREFAGPSSVDIDRSIIMFAESSTSTSVPLLRTPDVITEDLLMTANIKFYVNRISTTLGKMSTLPDFAPNIITLGSVEKFAMTVPLKFTSMGVLHLRRHAVRQIIQICDLLETELIQVVSVYDGACALDTLSEQIALLDMGHESLILSKWAIALVRMLLDAAGDDHPDLKAKLARHLLSQSIQYRSIGDKSQSLETISEAYAISRNLAQQFEQDVQLQILYSDVLLQHARVAEIELSIAMCVVAVRVLEDIVDARAFAQSKLNGDLGRVARPNPAFLQRLFSSAPPPTAIMSYAQALQDLGSYLFVYGDGHADTGDNALDLWLLSIAVRREMVSVLGSEYKVELHKALWTLVGQKAAYRLPSAELVDMAEECAHLLRDLAKGNPAHYARRLFFVLREKAMHLESLDRNTEAIAAWEEAAALADQVVQDSTLYTASLAHLSSQFRRVQNYSDAAWTETLAIQHNTHHVDSSTRAKQYLLLASDLQHLRKFRESAEAAQKSITLHRHLEMRDPGKWAGQLHDSLSCAARSLAASGSPSEAFVAWKEAMHILQNFESAAPHPSSNNNDLYVSRIRRATSFCYLVDDKETCLQASSTVVLLLRRLSETYPENEAILRHLKTTEERHPYHMFRVGCLLEAQHYIEKLLETESGHTDTSSDFQTAMRIARLVRLKATILDAQGCTEQALSTTKKAQDIAGVHGKMYQGQWQEMELQVSLGNCEEALDLAKEVLELYRGLNPRPLAGNLVWCLYTTAYAALSCGDYKRAEAVAQEGYELTNTPDWQANEDELDIFLRPHFLAMLSSSEANLGRLPGALQHARQAVDLSLDIMGMKHLISVTNAEEIYMKTRGNLAEILLETNDLTEARQICEERKAYFSRRVEDRMGDYRELVPTLRVLGILFCGEGRHQDGDAVAHEFTRIMSMLACTFPSLQEQVKFCLGRQTKLPTLKEVLDSLRRNLDCEHQNSVFQI